MDGVPAELAAQASKISDLAQLNLSESDTRVYLIDPVLRLLGYADHEHLRREVPIPETKERMDYLLYQSSTARVAVEAKRLNLPLVEKDSAQCVQYAAVLGVRWCVITNGAHWLIYDAYAKAGIRDKQVADVRLDGDEAELCRAWNVLARFARPPVAPINDLLIERLIAEELSQQDSRVVVALRKAFIAQYGERISAQQVIEAAKRLGLATATTFIHAYGIARAGQSPPLTPSTAIDQLPTRRAQANVPSLKFADVIAAGLLTEGALLRSVEPRHPSIAYVRGSDIEMNGVRYRSPSAAAEVAAGSKRNGWVFWTSDGVQLSVLRTQLAQSLTSNK